MGHAMRVLRKESRYTQRSSVQTCRNPPLIVRDARILHGDLRYQRPVSIDMSLISLLCNPGILPIKVLTLDMEEADIPR